MSTNKHFRFTKALNKAPAMLSKYWFLYAFGLLLLIGTIGTSGCSLIVNPGPGGGEVEEVEDLLDNAFEVLITVPKSGPIDCEGDICFSKPFSVCMPDELNPNKNGGVEPGFDDLVDFCNSHLIPIAAKMQQECSADAFKINRFECEVFPVTFLDSSCEKDCDPITLDAECTNLETATAVKDEGKTACLAAPDEDGDGVQQMGAALSGRSTCVATGDLSEVTITRGTDDPKTKPADGVVEFDGDLSSEISVSYRVDNVGNFTFDGIFGLPIGEATLKNISSSGASTSLETVNIGGEAFFGPGTVLSTGGGALDKPFGLGTDEATYVATNQEDVKVTTDLQNNTCTIETTTMADDDGTPVEIFTLLIGDIVNQPPKANAGDDETVECTSPDGVEVMLDGTDSTDPDENIVTSQWRRGSRAGDEIGTLEAEVTTDQALDTTEEYFLNVMDAFMQMDSDSKLVNVVDTTAPTIACNSPSSITPREAPITFTATTEDTCDADAGGTVAIIDYDCFTFTKKGRRINKTESCIVDVNGDTITIVDSGGVDDYITWTVRANDNSDNVAESTCSVMVVNPSHP